LAPGISDERDPRTVDVHIDWLRSKIEPRPEWPIHLVTLRGFGYRLDPSAR
jgi:two-component system phosphate regulon response regulator PhoB